MSDEEALSAALDIDPGDRDTRLVLSDWYEQEGRHLEAEEQRWLVSVGKWPVKYTDNPKSRFFWGWWGQFHPHDSLSPGTSHCCIPSSLVSFMPRRAWIEDTRLQAERMLLEAYRLWCVGQCEKMSVRIEDEKLDREILYGNGLASPLGIVRND